MDSDKLIVIDELGRRCCREIQLVAITEAPHSLGERQLTSLSYR